MKGKESWRWNSKGGFRRNLNFKDVREGMRRKKWKNGKDVIRYWEI